MRKSNIPVEADELFNDLANEVFLLKAKWLVFSELFGNEEHVKLLNQSAPATFSYFLYSLLDDVNLNLTRLITDKAFVGQRANSNFELLIEKVDPNLHQALIKNLDSKLSSLRGKCRGFQNRRNRLIAHRDWNSVQPINPESVARISRAMVEDILPDMEAFLEDFYDYFNQAGFILTASDILTDIRTLLEVLKAGVNSIQEGSKE